MTTMRITLPLTIYGLTAETVGLVLILCPGISIWGRLLGLQVGMMGGYLMALGCDGQPKALRLVIWLRLGVPLGYVILFALGYVAVWFLVLGLVEVLWTWWILRSLPSWKELTTTTSERANMHVSVATMSQPVFPTRLHNVVLGLIPFGEGLGCLFMPHIYGHYILGLPVASGEVFVELFGLHTLYLAMFWGVVTTRGCRRTLWATVWGRVGVAVAFASYHLCGVVDPQSRLIWLIGPLLASAVWTVLELTWFEEWRQSRSVRSADHKYTGYSAESAQVD